ncbi:chorismate mutase [Oceanobacillus halophilus]|uniref:chorismate mutase n=1 Tax=Oceanobacillus halophilus TaxID=930130 RepID=A0A495ACE8_9BACI|nr:chorismate mutase [Oceanobacillus halophilus]RKQ37657.1 chorismate mutase [Oceanobacillus halophilus]
MTRGVRGATTVSLNEEKEILKNTKVLVEEMIEKNDISASDVSHVFISVTRDLNATFPAKVLREIEGWKYVPVMCMAEIDVPNSLPKCIRIMMVTNTGLSQEEIIHVFQNEAVKLRPDLIKGE